MSVKVWNEGGQRFTYEGACIRTLKPGIIKMAYGDERLREIRAQRALEPQEAERQGPVAFLRRMLSGILPGSEEETSA